MYQMPCMNYGNNNINYGNQNKMVNSCQFGVNNMNTVKFNNYNINMSNIPNMNNNNSLHNNIINNNANPNHIKYNQNFNNMNTNYNVNNNANINYNKNNNMNYMNNNMNYMNNNMNYMNNNMNYMNNNMNHMNNNMNYMNNNMNNMNNNMNHMNNNMNNMNNNMNNMNNNINYMNNNKNNMDNNMNNMNNNMNNMNNNMNNMGSQMDYGDNYYNYNYNNFKPAYNFCPFKPIINNNNITYVNAVLQSLANLKYINNWIKNLYQYQNQLYNKQITREIYNLFSTLYNGQYPNCTNLINNYNYKYNNTYGPNMKHNPYYFLSYLIDFIHKENNIPRNPYYDINKLRNINRQIKRNNALIYKIMYNYTYETQNSLISNGFYIMLRNQLICENCPHEFSYIFKTIIKFEIDNYKVYNNSCYPYNINQNLTLEQCFNYYTGGKPRQCENCGNYAAKSYTSIMSSSKILIIALLRNNHVYRCDIFFPIKLDIQGFYVPNQRMNNIYNLKAVVSLNYQGQYLSDIFLNNSWFRFLGNQNPISITENSIYNFEPQILFYELAENINIFNGQNNNYGVNNFMSQMVI